MPFTEQEIEETILRAVSAGMALPPDRIGRDSCLFTELEMDSLDLLDLMFNLEASFHTKIRDADFDRMLRPDKSEASPQGEFLTAGEIAGLAPILPSLQAVAATRPVARKELFATR